MGLMAPPELLYLTQQEVIDVAPSLADSVDLIEGVLREHGEKQVENPPKPGVHPLPDTFIHAMPAFLRRRRQVGLKWVSGFFDNPTLGLPSISGLIILNDPNTGVPTAVMDCAYLTALRTAAASGVAARHLANPDAAVLGIVGAGVQGRFNLITVKTAVPALRTVRLFDVVERTSTHFVREMAGHVDCEIQAVDSMAEAILGADVVVTATSQLHEVLFKAAWVREGALVLPVHSYGWEREAIEQADKFVADDWAQLRASVVGPGKLYETLPEPYAELGEIVVGRKPGRESPTERIIDFNYGLAIHDVAMGHEVLARARAKGLGTPLKQLDGVMPFSEQTIPGP